MSLEPTLLSMPGVVKDQLFQYLSYIDIARLHKTCKDLRDYINVSRPDARFHIIDISQYNGSVYLNLITKNKKDSVELEYKKSEQGCSILSSVGFRNFNFRNINGLDFIAAFCQDFAMVLRHQKSVLKEVEVCQYSEKIAICETIRKMLEDPKKNNNQIRTKDCKLTDLTPSDACSVLSSFDVKCLKSLRILGDNILMAPIDGILQVDHWKHLESVTLVHFDISNILPDIVHLRRFEAVTTMTSEEVIQLKNLVLQSTQLTYCQVYCTNWSTENDLYAFFGSNYVLKLDIIKLYAYKSRKSKDVWYVEVEDEYLTFEKLSVEKVPKNVTIVEYD